MAHSDSISGVLLEDVALSLEELARACEVEPDWVVRHVEAGLLGGEASVELTGWRFRSGDLRRARRLLSIERDFDANDELAALVVDLADEVGRLRVRLHALGAQ